MAYQAIDFTKVNTRAYKVWRILKAPGAWGKLFMEREQQLRNYRTAIIFPEQILGLDQKMIYQVIIHKVGKDVTSIISGISTFGLYKDGGRTSIKTIEDLSVFEAENSTPGSLHNLVLSPSGHNNVNFFNHAYFTSSKDAIKFQSIEQEALVSQIC